jgi:hypothetical protein
MLKLKVSKEESLNQLRSIRHSKCQSAIENNWRVDDDGTVKTQSICWLFCWGKTGLGSLDAASDARYVFDKIFNITFDFFDSRVPHEWARKARYLSYDLDNVGIDNELKTYLAL